MQWEVQRQVYKITQMRGHCVTHTQFIRDIWVPLDSDEVALARAAGGDLLVSMPFGTPHDQTMRMVAGNRA